MTTNIARLTVLTVVTLAGACSPKPAPRDTVMMDLGGAEAHVRLPSARVGDRIVCRRNHCEPDPSRGKTAQKCAMRVVGRATVVKLLSADYSAVTRTKGECQEGDLVEPAREE